ncbi:MAG TPA: NUDIX domain-containing protein [Nitrospirota bacterium]|nr:NUDIX domain-containing protein [Nitrospirota bacterium]
MNITEHFDVLDCRGKKTGEIIPRDEAHRSGIWHGAFHCFIFSQRDGRAYGLFQKRSESKKIAPGKFDVSVGGHYSAGEDAAVAGPREMQEELGLDVRFSDLLPVGRRIFVYCFTDGIKEYEFQDVFLLHRVILPESLTLQREELAGAIELEVEQGVELFSGKILRAQVPFTKTGGETVPISVTVDDFVTCLDNYYLKLLLLVRRYVRGERELLII